MAMMNARQGCNFLLILRICKLRGLRILKLVYIPWAWLAQMKSCRLLRDDFQGVGHGHEGGLDRVGQRLTFTFGRGGDGFHVFFRFRTTEGLFNLPGFIGLLARDGRIYFLESFTEWVIRESLGEVNSSAQ